MSSDIIDMTEAGLSRRFIRITITSAVLLLLVVGSLLTAGSADGLNIPNPPFGNLSGDMMNGSINLSVEDSIHGEVYVNETDFTYRIYRLDLRNESDVWIEFDRLNDDFGAIQVFVYDRNGSCLDDHRANIRVEPNEARAEHLVADEEEDGIYYILVYGNGSYELSVDHSGYFSIWWILVPIIIIFIGLISAAAASPFVLVRIRRKKNLRKIEKGMERNEHRMDYDKIMRTYRNERKSRKMARKVKRVMLIVLSVSIAVLLLLLGSLYFLQDSLDGIVLDSSLFLVWLFVNWVISLSIIYLVIDSRLDMKNRAIIPTGEVPRVYSGRKVDRHYREEKMGFWINSILVLIVPFFVLIDIFDPIIWWGAGIFLILGLLILLTGILTISRTLECDENFIRIGYGSRRLSNILRPWNKEIPLKEIHSARPVSMNECAINAHRHWGPGIGIHGEIMYGSKSRVGVRVILKNGADYYIGSEDPARLSEFIRRAM